MADSEEGTGATMDDVAREVKILAKQQAEHEEKDEFRHRDVKDVQARLVVIEGKVESIAKEGYARGVEMLKAYERTQDRVFRLVEGRDRLDGDTDKRDAELARLREQVADRKNARAWKTAGLVVSGAAAALAVPQLWELLLKLVHT